MCALEKKEINKFPTPQEDISEGKFFELKGKKYSYHINEKKDEIGRGAYGKVFKARRVNDNMTVALKKSQIKNNSSDLVFSDSTLKEISYLIFLRNHKNIIK